jgi:WD40 repeat protein
VVWLSKAAEADYADAQNLLGRCYDEGWGVRKDDSIAVQWYRKAAEVEHAEALYNLGLCYELGQGVEQDSNAARSLLVRSAECGHEPAKSALEQLDAATAATVSEANSSPSLIMNLTGHSATINSLAFSPDGRYIASASDDLTILIWDIRTGMAIRALRGHTRSSLTGMLFSWGVTSVQFSQDGSAILSGGGCDKHMRLWNATTGTEVACYKHPGNVTSAVFSPDDTLAAGVSTESDVRIWELRTAQLVGQLDTHFGTVNRIAFNPHWTQFLGGGYADGDIELWDVSTGRAHNCYRGHSKAVNDLAFSPDGMLMASAGDDMTIRVWDLTKGSETMRFGWHPAAVKSVAFSVSGHILLSCDGAGNIIFTRLSDGAEMWVHPGDQSELRSIAVSPDGRLFAAGGADGVVHIWSMA